MRLVLLGLGLALSSGVHADCSFPGEPTGPSRINFSEVASGFARPVDLRFAPGELDRYYVVEQYGLLKVVIDGRTRSLSVIDLTGVVNRRGNETGLLGMAFHPDYAENRRVFLNYTKPNPHQTRISEFRMDANSVLDPDSERILLEIDQPYSNHNGGDIKFGPDGYLYIPMGDGGWAGDPQGHGQNLRTLLAKMLRIDVDNGDPYTIPDDNPSFSDPRARPEIFAYGLRNPWRVSFDRVTGTLWAGDVGQDALEEIDIIVSGGNYGWNVMEGRRCFRNPNCNRADKILPIIDYPQTDGQSVTGGYVYRGNAMPELVGTYLYADYVSGKVWGIRVENGRVADHKTLADTSLRISSFGENSEGELYALDHRAGKVYKLQRAAGGGGGDFPRKLSETGCFRSTDPLIPASGVTPFFVNAPLWSDGALKERFVKVPGGRKIVFQQNRPWDYPTGTVLVKNFYVPQRRGSDIHHRIVETRFLVKRMNGFKGYTYAWNDDETDAVFLAGAKTKRLRIDSANTSDVFDYYFPSSSDCKSCHIAAAGGPLALTTPQANRLVETVGARFENQLSWLADQDIIDRRSLPDDLNGLPAYPPFFDASRSVASRARAYLQVQCAECHNRDYGTAQGDFDFRWSLSFSDMEICNADPINGDLGIPGAKLFVPGDYQRSLLWQRMHRLDRDVRMPPMASHRRDAAGSTLLQQWIMQTGDCP